MDLYNDDFDRLDALIDGGLDEAVNGLVNADSVLGGAHAAADLLQGIGQAIPIAIDGVDSSIEGLGDEIEVIGEPLGEIGELAFGIIGESVETICEASIAVAEPIIEVAAALVQDTGLAIDSGADAIEHVMNGDLGEAASSVAGIASHIPDIAGDVSMALAELAFGPPCEIAEGVLEIGWEIIEGVEEIVIDPANESINEGGNRHV